MTVRFQEERKWQRACLFLLVPVVEGTKGATRLFGWSWDPGRTQVFLCADIIPSSSISFPLRLPRWPRHLIRINETSDLRLSGSFYFCLTAQASSPLLFSQTSPPRFTFPPYRRPLRCPCGRLAESVGAD